MGRNVNWYNHYGEQCGSSSENQSQTLEKLMVSKEERLGGWYDALGVCNGNPIKLDCDDHCTTINVINSFINKK